MSYNVDAYRTQMYRFNDRTLVCPPGSVPDPKAPGLSCLPVNVPKNPAWLPPPLALQGLAGCGCQARPAGGTEGLGDPLLCATSGAMVFDAGLGAAVGALLAPEGEERMVWGAGGAAAGALGGLFGVLLTAGVAIYMRARR